MSQSTFKTTSAAAYAYNSRVYGNKAFTCLFTLIRQSGVGTVIFSADSNERMILHSYEDRISKEGYFGQSLLKGIDDEVIIFSLDNAVERASYLKCLKSVIDELEATFKPNERLYVIQERFNGLTTKYTDNKTLLKYLESKSAVHFLVCHHIWPNASLTPYPITVNDFKAAYNEFKKPTNANRNDDQLKLEQRKLLVKTFIEADPTGVINDYPIGRFLDSFNFVEWLIDAQPTFESLKALVRKTISKLFVNQALKALKDYSKMPLFAEFMDCIRILKQDKDWTDPAIIMANIRKYRWLYED